MDTINRDDYKFVPVDPDPGFDPEHNKRVMEETIRESERMRRLKQAEYKDKLGERAYAVSQYIKSINQGASSSSVMKFFGKEELARLRGEQIVEVLKGKLSNAKIKEARQKAKLSTFVPGRVS